LFYGPKIYYKKYALFSFIKLKEELNFTAKVRPACLPSRTFIETVGDFGIVAGYGRVAGFI
jgi:hypothetical protein